MGKMIYKEYTNFQEFYDICKEITDSGQQIFAGNIKQIINSIRENYEQEYLNGFYFAAELPPHIVKILRTGTPLIKISVDTMIKNLLEHPEIGISEYLNIKKYVENAEYIFIKNAKNLI